MPLLTDGDVTRGWLRERRLLKRLYELTFVSRSPAFKSYVKGVSEVTGLPPEEVLRSRPVRNYLRRLMGGD